jgi:hypothetical protein
MDLISTVLQALLFAVFVPGVLFHFPKNGDKAVVLVVHAFAFSIVSYFVMQAYWKYTREHLTFGTTCPNGSVNMGPMRECKPVAHATYPPGRPELGSR